MTHVNIEFTFLALKVRILVIFLSHTLADTGSDRPAVAAVTTLVLARSEATWEMKQDADI